VCMHTVAPVSSETSVERENPCGVASKAKRINFHAGFLSDAVQLIQGQNHRCSFNGFNDPKR
jgi:hypothetical protein